MAVRELWAEQNGVNCPQVMKTKAAMRKLNGIEYFFFLVFFITLLLPPVTSNGQKPIAIATESQESFSDTTSRASGPDIESFAESPEYSVRERL